MAVRFSAIARAPSSPMLLPPRSSVVMAVRFSAIARVPSSPILLPQRSSVVRAGTALTIRFASDAFRSNSCTASARRSSPCNPAIRSSFCQNSTRRAVSYPASASCAASGIMCCATYSPLCTSDSAFASAAFASALLAASGSVRSILRRLSSVSASFTAMSFSKSIGRLTIARLPHDPPATIARRIAFRNPSPSPIYRRSACCGERGIHPLRDGARP